MKKALLSMCLLIISNSHAFDCNINFVGYKSVITIVRNSTIEGIIQRTLKAKKYRFDEGMNYNYELILKDEITTIDSKKHTRVFGSLSSSATKKVLPLEAKKALNFGERQFGVGDNRIIQLVTEALDSISKCPYPEIP